MMGGELQRSNEASKLVVGLLHLANEVFITIIETMMSVIRRLLHNFTNRNNSGARVEDPLFKAYDGARRWFSGPSSPGIHS